MSNIIQAKEGETLSGDELQDIFDESKATGRTIASLAREKLKDASITTILSPGEGVVELNKRYSRRNKK